MEETAKAAGFVLLIVMAPRLIRTTFDGLVVGHVIGLGFQVFEDWLYTVQEPPATSAAASSRPCCRRS